jgi:phage antirepressor YoqD-like protein
MTNLTKVETNNGVEIYIENSTGEAFTSISGYARMANLARQTIQDRLSRRGIELKIAEVPTAKGLQRAALLDESLICLWLSKDNPAMAIDMMRLGVRKFLHTMAGFKPESDTPIQKLPTPKELALMLLAAEEDKERLSAELDHAVETITTLEPKAVVFDEFISSDGLTSAEDLAKSLAIKGLGRNKIIEFLRERKYIGQNNRPYQSFVNQGLLEVKAHYTQHRGYEFASYQPMFTSKGVAKFTPMLIKEYNKG